MAADDDNAASQLLDSNNLTKYKTAAEIANRVLAHVVTLCVAEADIGAICESGDKMIEEECAKVYKNPEKDAEGKKVAVAKGVAFPTCVSVNNCVCHFSPLRSEPSSTLKDGDVVKIDLGVHVGGFPAPVATTLVVGASAANPVTGPKADVILATYYATEAAIRMLKPENKNTMVTDMIKQVAEAYHVTPVENMVSYQVSKDKIDDGKNIIQNPSDEQKQQYKSEAFDVNEVYAIDILCSTGNGKAIPRESRTTVFKRTGTTYQLKMKTSRAVLSEISSKFTTMPFSLRGLDDEKKARMGVVECQSHGLVEAYPVMFEKDGAFVAQFKSTAIISKNGIVRITSPVFDASAYKSEYKIEDEKLNEVLAEELGSKKKANKKKPAKSEGDKPEA